MMPLSQMLSPAWQMMRTLLAATEPKDSSRSASPNVTTAVTREAAEADSLWVAVCTSCAPWEYPETTILVDGHRVIA